MKTVKKLEALLAEYYETFKHRSRKEHDYENRKEAGSLAGRIL